MGRLAVLTLRGVIVALSLGTVFVRVVMVPLSGADLEGLDTVVAWVRTPTLAIVVLGMVAVQAVLFCVWRLVTMVRRETVFSHGAFRYVHGVIGVMVAAAMLVFSLGVVLAPGEAVAPGIVLLLGVLGLAVLGVALIVLVLRMLLAQAVARDIEATRMRAEPAEAI